MKRAYKKYFKTISLIWSSFLVLFVLVYLLVLSPQAAKYNDLKAQLDAAESAYNRTLKSTGSESLNSLKEQMEMLQSRLKDFIIDFSDTANLTFDISQIATEKQVSSFSITDQSSRKNSEIPNCDYISEKQVDIKFQANFNQFSGLLNALERHRPVVFVDEFSISRSNDGTSGNEVEMNLSVFVTKQDQKG
ncbi:MAG: hypothetical protein E4H40_04675 [Candidatus Brocadiia bacterium]|nr:MAG: hypothetical protein E4H40_04675 [Candidatus Brocadiia bacterium]